MLPSHQPKNMKQLIFFFLLFRHVILVLALLLSKALFPYPACHSPSPQWRQREDGTWRRSNNCPSLACPLISYVDDDGYSCSFFPSQEKLKPQYLEQLPGQLKQFSLFLGKYSWFAGEKVGRRERERIPVSAELHTPDHLTLLLLAHLCGLSDLWCLRPEPYVWAQVPGWVPKSEGFHVPLWGDAPCPFLLQTFTGPRGPIMVDCYATPVFA